MQSIPLDLIEEALTLKPSRILGTAPDDTIEKVKTAIEISPTISIAQINWALAALTGTE